MHKMQHSTTRQAKQNISANLDHHWCNKCSFLCVQTNWVCPPGTQRFCKSDSDSSLESLTVTRVESSHYFSQRDSSRVRVTKNRDSSHAITDVASHFIAKQRLRKNFKFHFTRHWLELANRRLEETRPFLWLGSDSTRASHGSTLTRLEKIWMTLTRRFSDFDSTKLTRTHHCPTILGDETFTPSSKIYLPFFWSFILGNTRTSSQLDAFYDATKQLHANKCIIITNNCRWLGEA